MCQTACTSADFSFHGLIQNKTVLSFASIIYVTSLCCHSISLFLFHLSNSPLYVVILFSLFKFYLFTSAFLFCHCISPFYFATVFRLVILPIFLPPSILFHHLFSPFFFFFFYFFFLFRHSFRPLFYFAILFHPLFYFAILFALLFCLFFYFLFFLFIFSNANSFPHFYIRS